MRADLDVHITATTVSPGNPALLRCEVSPLTAEYTEVKEWLRDGQKIAGVAQHGNRYNRGKERIGLGKAPNIKGR